MENNFIKALTLANEKEFKWLNDFNNPFENYTFSQMFEFEMNKIVFLSEKNM